MISSRIRQFLCKNSTREGDGPPGEENNSRNRRAGFSPPVFRFAAWGSAMDLPGANRTASGAAG